MNPKQQIFGYAVDAIRMPEAVNTVLTWVAAKEHRCQYVVTPNVDHTVMYQERADLRAAYADAGMVLADGMPVVVAARLLGKPVPERVPGSDLVYRIFDEVEQQAQKATQPTTRAAALVGAGVGSGDEPSYGDSGSAWAGGDERVLPSRGKLRVYLLGAMPGVAERAAVLIHERWPSVEVVGTYSPPLGFEKDPHENFQILRRIASAKPDLLIVGLGAPKQELWVHAHRDQIRASATLCVGATIDFLAGDKPRAPRWMQRTGFEWLHRLVSEPKRLARRYARDAWIFPRIVWREYQTAANSRSS